MTDRLERDITAMEKEIRQLKTKLDNSIIDIRAVNFYGWVNSAPAIKARTWEVVRHEIQYKRQGSSEWISIPTINRDDENSYIQIVIPNGELEE
jgi:uncharacterized membrane protein YqhA